MRVPTQTVLIYVTASEPVRTYRIESAIPRCNPKDIAMKINEGVIDRSLRVAVGLILIGMAFTGTIGAWCYLGVIPLVTGAVGMCPLYSLLGINSCPAPRA